MKKVKLLFFASLTSIVVSCDSYFDVNDNPNDLHTDQALPSQYLPAAQLGAHRVQASTMNRLGLLFSNATGGNVSSYASPFTNEFNLNISTTFYSGIFEGLYSNVNVFQKIIDFPDTTGKYDEYKAVSKISKAYYMQYLVDLYGNVPYTQAFKGSANLTPAYDDDQEIYLSLFEELDEARYLIDNLSPDAEALDTKDIVMGGDLNKWYEFANTIELKMLVRMSNTTGATATRRDARLNALAGASFITSDVTIQPGFDNTTSSKVNPLNLTFGWDQAGNTTGRNLYCASGHFVKCVNPYSSVNYASPAEQEVVPGSGVFYPNVSDPRRSRVYSFAASSPISFQKGVTQGSSVVDVTYPGQALGGQPSKFSFYFFDPYLQVSPSGYNGGIPNTAIGNYYAEVDGYIMTAAESYFIQAEAAHLAGSYAVLGLDAQTLFNSGVVASMPYYATSLGSYLTTINTKPNFGYNSSFTFAQNHHAIMYQKWIAVLNSNAIEAYIDQNRTGYPLNPMPIGSPQTHRPYRLLYPNSEYIANTNNVINLSLNNLFDISNQYLPFWMLGDPALGN
jgi:hypothetical protein